MRRTRQSLFTRAAAVAVLCVPAVVFLTIVYVAAQCIVAFAR